MAYSDDGMDQHIEALKARHAAHPDEGREYHRFAHDALGLKGAAKQQVVKERNVAAVAHLIRNKDVRDGISKLDDRSQVEELKKIREGEQSGPKESDQDTPEGVDAYLKLSGHFKNGRRETRAALRR